MLVLTRKPHEALYVGSEIIIAVLNVNGNQVKIGIDAPEDVVVLRDELLNEKNSMFISHRWCRTSGNTFK